MPGFRKIIITMLLLAATLQAENIYATFTVEADKSANLAFTASGRVEEVHADIGTVVQKDTLLARLQNDDIKAMLQQTRIQLKFAQRELTRQQKIKKLIDQSKFDQVLSAYEIAKANLAYQQALLDKTFLKAPFDGVIYDKDIEVGDAVSGMMLKTVFKIQSLHARKLILSFDQKYHHVVKAGQTFVYKVDGDETTYRGVITKVYPYADYDNRKIKAEVKAKDITVGLFGDGEIIVDRK